MKPCEHEAKIDPYLLGRLGESETAAFEEHYFNCPSCFQKTFARNELVDVLRYKGASIFAPEEGERPDEVERIPLRNRIAAILAPRPWMAVAAAAALLLVVIVGVVPRSKPGGPAFTGVEDMTVRGAAISSMTPAGGLSRAPAVLAWRGVAGAAEYAVSLFKGADLAWSATTAAERIELPAGIRDGLAAGTAYAWQVKAYSVQGTMLGASARTEFTIAK
jgi:hypothetical protein